MRAFFQGFPIWNAVRTELSWAHYRTLLRVENEQAPHWYMNEAASQNWTSRAVVLRLQFLDKLKGPVCHGGFKRLS
jgi:hypothetical protein